MEVGLESVLRARARELIRRRVLPRIVTNSVFAGPGSGGRCALCDRPITPQEVEYEIQPDEAQAPLLFHLACELEYSTECRTMEQEMSCLARVPATEPAG